MRPLLALTAALLATPVAARAGDQPNVIIVLTDTLRADHLGAYGNPRPGLTPKFDAFAAESVLFEDAIAQCAWTVPSVTSLFTGLYPTAHGVLGFNGKDVTRSDSLSPKLDTVAEVFQAAGYHTGALVKSPVILAANGMGHGFDEFHIVEGADARLTSGAELTDRANTYVDEQLAAGKPYFLYLHYMDPHEPYIAPPNYYNLYTDPTYQGGLKGFEVKQLVRGERPNPEQHAPHMLALYDAEIRYWDEQIGRLIGHLKQNGTYQNTVILFVADHGEMFYEHGHWSHQNEFQENIHVPFVVHAPGLKPARLAGRVEQFDASATALDLAGIARPPTWQARSLLPDIR